MSKDEEKRWRSGAAREYKSLSAWIRGRCDMKVVDGLVIDWVERTPSSIPAPKAKHRGKL